MYIYAPSVSASHRCRKRASDPLNEVSKVVSGYTKELTLGPLPAQQVLLIAEPSLRTLLQQAPFIGSGVYTYKSLQPVPFFLFGTGAMIFKTLSVAPKGLLTASRIWISLRAGSVG